MMVANTVAVLPNSIERLSGRVAATRLVVLAGLSKASCSERSKYESMQ